MILGDLDWVWCIPVAGGMLVGDGLNGQGNVFFVDDDGTVITKECY